MKTFLIVGSAILLLSAGVQSGEADGGVAGAFFQIPSGARPTAMGGAYLAVSDDGASPLYNPAGISEIKRIMLSSSYRTLSFGRNLGYLTALFPIQGDAAIGLHWLYAGSGSVATRDSDGALKGEDFSLNNHQFAVVFGKKFEKYLSVGATVNYLISSFPDVNVTSVGFDFGTIIHVNNLFDREKRSTMSIKDIRIGMTIRNLAKELKWNNEDYIFPRFPNTLGSIQNDKIPLEVGLGVSARFFEQKLLLATDLVKNEKQGPDFRIGSEYFVTNKFALRIGYGNSHLAAGTGFLFSMGSHILAIDYAFSADRVDEDSEHIFSFDLLF